MKININKFKRRVTPFMLTFSMLTTFVGCNINNNKSDNNYSITTSNTLNENLLKPLKKAGFRITEIKIDENFPLYKLENNIPEYFTSVKPASDGSNIYNIYQDYSFDKCCTVGEFKKYINSSDVTWNDVKESLKTNNNIEDDIKQIVLKGIENLEKNGFDIDLSVLNYNFKNLKLEYIAKDTELPMEVMAKFEPAEHTIYINPNTATDPLFESVVIHEILGHGSNITYLDSDGGIYCSTTIGNAIIEDQGVLLGTVVLGKAFEEGLAEYIRYLATNEKIDVNETSYSVPLYYLLMMCRSSNTSIIDYTNNGVEYLIEKMQQEKLGSVSHFIELLDIKFNYLTLGNMDTEWSYNDTMYQYLIIYINKLISEGKNKGDIVNTVNNLCNCYKKYLVPINVDNSNLIYTPMGNGDMSFLAIDGIKEQSIEYVDYMFENNKALILQ